MKSILILSNTLAQIKLIQNSISQEFTVMVGSNMQDIENYILKTNLVLIDEGFVEKTGFAILSDILKLSTLPILILTPPENPFYAIEALRNGAFNYIVKINRYESILPVSINEAINRFTEQHEAKRIIISLRKKVEELEKQLAVALEKKEAITGATIARKEELSRKSLMEEIISRFKKGDINLPSLPQMTIKFRELADSGADLKELAELLKKDLAISTKLINVSNSIYYKGLKESKTVEEAIGRLGLSVTMQYVDVIANRSLYTVKNHFFSNIIEELWHHSLAVAFTAQFILEGLALKLKYDVFTLGLLHDIGKLVLLQILGELIMKEMMEKTTSYEEVKETLDKFHGKFGGVLLKRWGFNDVFIQVALYHDELEKSDNISRELLVVHFSNIFVNQMGYTIGGFKNDPLTLDGLESARLLKIEKALIDQLYDKVKEAIDAFRNIFK